MVHIIASGKTKVTNGISTLLQTSAALLTKLMKMIPVEPIKNLSSLPRRDLVVALAWAPIVAMDVVVQVSKASGRSRVQLVCVTYFSCSKVFLLAYTMAFQCLLYFLYVGLFLFCLMVRLF